jgi:hypothetical protein
MDKFKCEICSETFKSKFSLERHHNKKNKCNIITNFQCLNCNKYFKYKKNLSEHQEKNICNNKNNIIKEIEKDELIVENKINNNYINNDDISLKILIDSNITNDKKIELIHKYHKIEINDLITIFDSNLKTDEKITVINNFFKNKLNDLNNTKISNINNGTINTNQTNNTTTNTTNNIQINNFGKEKIDYLDNEYFKDLIMNNHIQTAYMKLIEDTYLHKDHPENKTIKIDNLNNKFGFVFEDGKWRPILKYELKEIMHEKNNKLLKIHYKKVREFLDTAKKSSINVFFSRQYDHDPHLKLMNDQMVLLFYEGKKEK